jgi:hypothetical protein
MLLGNLVSSKMEKMEKEMGSSGPKKPRSVLEDED